MATWRWITRKGGENDNTPIIVNIANIAYAEPIDPADISQGSILKLQSLPKNEDEITVYETITQFANGIAIPVNPNLQGP